MSVRNALAALSVILTMTAASAANIVELWDQVTAPPAPKLAGATVKAGWLADSEE